MAHLVGLCNLRGLSDAEVAFIIPNRLAPDVIERVLLALGALLAAEAQVGELLLGGRLLVQPLLARLQQILLGNLLRDRADVLDGLSPNSATFARRGGLGLAVSGENCSDITHLMLNRSMVK